MANFKYDLERDNLKVVIVSRDFSLRKKDTEVKVFIGLLEPYTDHATLVTAINKLCEKNSINLKAKNTENEPRND